MIVSVEKNSREEVKGKLESNITEPTITVQDIKQGDFERTVLKSETPVVLDFYADWCGPCKIVSPISEALSKEYAGRVSFAKVDTDVNEELAARYDFMSTPTVMIFRDGRVIDKIIGAAPAQAYRRRIDSALGTS